MRDVQLSQVERESAERTFAACVAAILERPLREVPVAPPDTDPATGWTLVRWLGGRGVGIAPVAGAAAFSWAGPWIARVRVGEPAQRRAVVMYGVPSGVAWDPSGITLRQGWEIEDGFLLAPLDVALVRPATPTPVSAIGTVAEIWVADAAGVPARSLRRARALPGEGLEGDRHVGGSGTFPSGLPGSAITLIEAEVCESFDPPLRADEHRRNVVTRGIGLNALVGREFSVGGVRMRGMRLCEPCRVIEGYASRPVLRALVHRGGLRADILSSGEIRIGDAVQTR